MIDITDQKNCCGCSACASICHKQCISMVTDNEGRIVASIAAFARRCVMSFIQCLKENTFPAESLYEGFLAGYHPQAFLLRL